MSARSEQIGMQINNARDRVCIGPDVLHGFPARRRPILTFAGFLGWSVVCAIPAGIFMGVLERSDRISWRSVLPLFLLILFTQVTAMGTRKALGVCADGSLVVARYSTLAWKRTPVSGIQETFGPRTPISVDESAPWWRKPKVSIGGEVWYVNDLGEGIEPETLQRWVHRTRPTSVTTAH